MKILVNASTCVVGGGMQVAAAFVSRALQEPGPVSFRFALSPQVAANLPGLTPHDSRVAIVTPSPARLWQGHASRHALQAIENQFRPDVVFTVFGPAYVRFRSPHVCGFADGWVTHPAKHALSALPALQRARIVATSKYKERHLSRRDYYWVETETARRGLSRLLRLDATQTKVIANCYAPCFAQYARAAGGPRTDATVRVLTLAGPYPHKQLLIIPEVARLLARRSPTRTYRMVVTLPHDGPEVTRFWAKATELGVMSMIQNAGTLRISECPRWYDASDMLFLPTLLETFSATYLEAMVMGRPIVTTDLDFARDVCGEAAQYFSPLSANDAADAIAAVATNSELRQRLVQHGYDRLQLYPTPEGKYEQTMRWLAEVADLARSRRSFGAGAEQLRQSRESPWSSYA